MDIQTVLVTAIIFGWNVLTEPSWEVGTPDMRIRSRLAASVFAISFLAVSAHIAIGLLTGSVVPPALVFSFLLLIVLMQVSRTRHLEYAIKVGLGYMWLAFFVTLVDPSTSDATVVRILIIWPIVTFTAVQLFYGTWLSVSASFVTLLCAGLRFAQIESTALAELVPVSSWLQIVLTITALLVLQRLEAAMRIRHAVHQHASVERTRLILDNVADIVVNVDSNLEIQYVNMAATLVLGYRPDEFEGRSLYSVFEIMHPDDISHMLMALKDVLANKRSVRTEYRLRHKNGSYIWVETVSNFLLKPDGPLDAILFTGRDISERKQAAAALEASEQRYGVLINSFDGLVWLLDPATNMTDFASSQAKRILGFEPEAMLANPQFWKNHIHPEDYARMNRCDQSLLDGGPTQIEYRFIKPDGTTIWLQDNIGALIEPGTPRRLIGVTQDITKRKQAEQALYDAREYYESLVSSVEGMIWEMDAATLRTTFVSPQVESMFGFTVEEVVNDPAFWAYHIHADDWSTMAKQYQRAVSERKGYVSQYRLIDSSGHLRWIRGHVTVIVRNNVVRSLVGINIDITDLKEAQAALAASTARFEKLVNSVDGVVWTGTTDFVIDYLSQHIETLLGYPRQRFVEDPNYWIDQVHEADRPWVIQQRRESVAAGQGLQLEYRMRTASGGLIWVRDTAHFLKGADGENRLFGLTVNITRLMEAQTAEREQRMLAEALGDSIAALTQTIDLDEIYDLILRQVHRIVGGDTGNIMLIDGNEIRVVRIQGYEKFGVSDEVRLHRSDMDEYANLRWMFDHKQPVVYADVLEIPEWKRPRPFSWIRSYIGAPILLDNQVIGFINADSAEAGAFSEQVAQRLQVFANQAALAIRNAQLYSQVKHYAEELESLVEVRTDVLAQERRQLQAILNGMAEGVAFTSIGDTGVEVEYVNRALEELTGYPAETWKHHPLRLYPVQLPHAEAVSNDQQAYLRSLMERGYWREEVRMTRANGTQFDAAVTTTRVDGPGGELVGAVSVVRDISQDKALAEQRTRFVAHASHELRTPITNLITRLYLLRQRPERLSYHLDILDEVAVRMKRLADDLLDVSRLERGSIALRLEPQAIQDVAESVIRLQEAEAERKLIQLRFFAPDVPLLVLADRERLAQVFTNLIVNAINYTPEHGIVTSSIAHNVTANCAEVKIEDTGVGIAVEHLEHIFQPFFRVPDEGEVKGSGLGLAIVRELIEMHGGTIDVSSKPGQGSQFVVHLPLVNELASTS